jgi:hypothetical protein
MLRSRPYATAPIEQINWREDDDVDYSHYRNSLEKVRGKVRREAKKCNHVLSRFIRSNFNGVPMVLAHCKTPGCRYAAAINVNTLRYTGPDLYRCPLSI